MKGFKIFKDRHGKARCYHRATGTAVDLAKAPLGSPEFFAECGRISALSAAPAPAKPGTLGRLVEEYRAAPSYTDLRPRTRSDYAKCLDYLKPIADTPLIRFDSPLVVRIRDKAASKHGRRFGNYVKAVLSIVFAWGAERGYLDRNPADSVKNIRRPRDAPEANRPWSDGERHAVWDAMPAHMLPAVALMMYCGLDPQDALSLPRSAIRDGLIDSRRGKTSEPLWLPLPQPVSDAIMASPPHSAVTVCATSRGHVWTVSGFRASWRPIRQRLEKAGAVRPGLTLKGLRHTVATILAEIGFDNRSIADLLGQKTEAMAAHYSRRADRTRKNTATIESFAAEVNRRRTKVVKPSE
ncbi:tyrosine-type recombinase/integrase [Aurantimonas sp. A2-1-M11]|uniref:tyrosine-type recombinase/integrase n=1 Tax=Aurantimonas sp. A2-1-M11 TaxID=3113712 RepID=UPI002F948465